ncbi:glyoxalase [Asticcacaulis sp. AC460]|uniref:VOC family protein n=1 Tax=Asticcacaulis sp. AC460 TaxID=1282360 RepID=UPI0003C3B600|nr:VOC family protein [Asticcacaulis sp. AC460]ESQ91524.1 glyoxalase [Asticcacaulis sp. AC460]
MRALLALALLAATPVMAEPTRPPITGVSHIAVYADDLAKTNTFYTRDLGGVKKPDAENPAGARYHFAPAQFVEVLPLPAGEGINRLDHVAFVTTDAEALRAYLAFKKVTVPAKVSTGTDGSLYFSVTDPEGNVVEFVQPPKALPDIPVNPLSHRMMHVGFIIHNRAKQDTFYRDILEFKPYWAGGFQEDVHTWISIQVPEGRDWLEYMLVSGPETEGIPPNMSQKIAGILNHFALGVPDVRDSYTLLWNENRLTGQEELPKIGRDAKWQLNLFDPDGTRAEVMEFKAIGKPCCSPFTAEDPEP